MMKARKFAKLQKTYTQNLTRCKIFKAKFDASLKSWFKIWRIVKCWFKIWQDENFVCQNHAFYKKFLFKTMLFTKNFHSKSCFSKKFSSKSCFLKVHVKRKNCAFYGVNWTKTWFFVCKLFKIVLFKNNSFFKIVLFKNNFFFKIVLFNIFFSSKSCFLNKYSDSKSDAL